jgi:ribosome-binding factor A
MQSLRQERVRELLKRQIGEVIRRELPVNEAGVISVNEVGVSNDLHSAIVFVGIVGTDIQRKRGLALLQQERKRIQGLVARAVILKYTPQLKFVVDDTASKATRVLEIIEDLERDPPPHEDDPKDH